MKNRAIWNYLLRNIFWSIWALWIYRHQLYCSVLGLTGEQSVWLLRALVAASVFTGFLLTFRNRRSGLNIFISIVCPIGIYYMLSLWTLEHERIAKVMGWTCVLAVCYVLLMTIHYIRDKAMGRTRAQPRKCAFGCFMGVRTIVALAMAVLLAGTCIDLLPMDVAHSRELSTHPGADRISRNQLIEENMNDLLALQPDVWRSLDLDERLEVLRVASEIECTNLGIPLVRVRAISMAENTMGGYDHASRTVMLSLEHLAFDPVEEVLDTLLHEIRHAYQYGLVELYQSLDKQTRNLALFHDISDYAYEFDNYISGSGGGKTFQDYFEQKCEMDSTAFAGHTISVYYHAISTHIVKNEFEEVPMK